MFSQCPKIYMLFRKNIELERVLSEYLEREQYRDRKSLTISTELLGNIKKKNIIYELLVS